jgi:acyl-CoA reductase-like NAD-dependent aldehyde dehydrogenase
VKQIDGVDEDVWFEHVAADVLAATSTHTWQTRITAHVAPLLPKVAETIDAHTAAIAEDIVAYMIIGALHENEDDADAAVRFLRGE